MKATGIVRRVDDLGRIVIPKEIRRTLRIREGDPLEIYTDTDGEVIFKKYSPMGEMASFAIDLAAAMSLGSELTVAICDRDHCIAAGGGGKTLLEKAITPELENICEQRRLFVNENGDKHFAFEDAEQKLCVAAPVINAGDIVGCVVLLQSEKSDTPTQEDIKLAEVAAAFLSARSE